MKIQLSESTEILKTLLDEKSMKLQEYRDVENDTFSTKLNINKFSLIFQYYGSNYRMLHNNIVQ